MQRTRGLGLVVLLLAGCTPEQLAQLQQPIVGGTTDPGDPGVVLVNLSGALCTGEVVSPHVVVTAGHCVQNPALKYSIFLGYDQPTEGNLAQLTVPVITAAHHPLFDINNIERGHDVSVLTTSEAIKVAPLYLNREPLTANSATKPVRVVGYGITTGADGGSSGAPGIKRQTTLMMTQTSLCLTADNAGNCTSSDDVPFYNDVLISMGNAMHDTCEGDSGGPGFQLNDNGVEVIVGLTSFGPGDNSGTCAGGYDDRVDPLVDFIDDAIAAAGDPPNVTPASPAPVPDMAVGSSGSSGGGGCSMAPRGTGDGVALLLVLAALGFAVRRRRLA